MFYLGKIFTTSCPYCDEKTFYRSSSRLKHWLRLLLFSDKRYCPACKSRWLDLGS